MKKGIFLFCFSLLFCFAAIGESSSPSGPNLYRIEGASERPKSEKCHVNVRTNVYRAKVYIDSKYAGETPLKVEVSAGYHNLEIKKEHYETRYFHFNLHEGQDKDFYVDLENIAGFIKIDNEYSGVDIYVDSSSTSLRSIEADEGNHVVTAKKFGYETFTENVYVHRHQTSNVTIKLRTAEFNITEITPSRAKFNPANRGRLGEIDIDFSVTAPETGTLKILDRFGNLCSSKEFSFTTWSQTFTWDGTDSGGYICADGV
ncbi:MAG: PEGA domain-containing protein [Treponema sp.]|nr:PEGA domain-containing protein [Treponema sp.]